MLPKLRKQTEPAEPLRQAVRDVVSVREVPDQKAVFAIGILFVQRYEGSFVVRLRQVGFGGRQRELVVLPLELFLLSAESRVLQVVLLAVCEDMLGWRLLVDRRVSLAETGVGRRLGGVPVAGAVVLALVAGLEVAGQARFTPCN